MSIEEVRELVAERQRYDEWLTALDGRRDETPGHVFERVHADYSARRQRVLERLHGHVSALDAIRSDLEARQAETDAAISALEDERAEAMLRSAVGELSQDQWESVRQDVEGRLASVTASRTSVGTELDEVRALLADARLGAPVPVEAPEPEPVALEAMEVVAEPDAVGATLVPEPSADDLVAPSDTMADIAAGLIEVDAAPAPRPAESVGVNFEADLDSALDLLAPAEARPEESVHDDVGFRLSVTSGQVADVFGDAAIPSRPEPATAAPAAAEGFDDLAFLRSVIEADSRVASDAVPAKSEATKTLRCTECGTMNLPTEWYCERCGGELAAF